MGLLSKLAMLPLAPAAGVIWIAEKMQEEAEREFFSPDAIRRQLAVLQAAVDSGAISQEEYLSQEEELLDRLDQVVMGATTEGGEAR